MKNPVISVFTAWFVSLWIPNSANYDGRLKVHFNIVTQIYKLLHYTAQRRDILLCILGISWFWFFGSIFLLEFPDFVKSELHAKASVVTYFLT